MRKLRPLFGSPATTWLGSLVDDSTVGDGGRADCLAPRVHPGDDFLRVAAGAEHQPDGERVAAHDPGLPLLEQEPCLDRRARHERFSLVIQNID